MKSQFLNIKFNKISEYKQSAIYFVGYGHNNIHDPFNNNII